MPKRVAHIEDDVIGSGVVAADACSDMVQPKIMSSFPSDHVIAARGVATHANAT